MFKFIPIFVVICFFHTRARNDRYITVLKPDDRSYAGYFSFCGGTLGLNTGLKLVIKSAPIYKDLQLLQETKFSKNIIKKQTFTATTGLNSQPHENVSEFYIMEPLILAKTSPNQKPLSLLVRVRVYNEHLYQFFILKL